MTDKFSIIPFRQLVSIVLAEIDKDNYFGIPLEIFFTPSPSDPFRMKRYGKLLETPLGVAAGPHTQLAQNIIAAWLCGARYIELKTVQTLDELNVSKPCIDMQEVGYNCEWSQELKIHESFDQYLNAWILIHLLNHKFGRKSNQDAGTIFNMSVGYNLEGIMNENVQEFFEKMNNCRFEKQRKIDEIADLYPAISEISIADRISDNVTLSTMHGCPPQEIEKIGKYLIGEKKLHTTIKLNPTLLGEDLLRDIIKNSGFEIEVTDNAFDHDLKYDDAVSIIQNLQLTARKNNIHFGLKLTNTLESVNYRDVFPATEKMMYMSGKALHPVAVQLAKKLQNEFDGELDISFSGGANAFNFPDLVGCGLTPVTVCSDLLKPGGYGLLKQYLSNLKDAFIDAGAGSIPEFIRNKNNFKDLHKAALSNLIDYSEKVLDAERYKRQGIHEPTIKTDRNLGYFDCIEAPCISNCSTRQDIPDYLYYTANNDFQNAFGTILRRNPFPNTTGMICDHLCQTKCTRINYDEALQIREIKRFVAENGSSGFKLRQADKNGLKVAIIGGGPSGLSAAYYLALAGFEIDIYETKDQPGGMVSGAIPSFRLTDEAFHNDIKRIESLGVSIHYKNEINKDKFEEIRKSSDYIYIAAGAQKSRAFEIEGQDAEGILDPLQFLFDVKKGQKTGLGKNVLIIGGGNTAMDAARTAWRLTGENGTATIVYRRTIGEMPADTGEIKAVMEEGMEIIELALPVAINSKNGKIISVTCIRMTQGEKDASGRHKPVIVPNSEFEIECDTVIPAIGQELVFDFLESDVLKAEPGIYETKIPGIFIGGDALRGASTAINAIGDGRKAAEKIIEKANIEFKIGLPSRRNEKDLTFHMVNRMTKKFPVRTNEINPQKRKNFMLVSETLNRNEAIEEASRCLLCDELCNICTTVCPNLANYSYEIEPARFELQKIGLNNDGWEILPDQLFEVSQKYQIIHIADWCNECGNCTTFCPTADSPYKNKPHLYLNHKAFEKDDDCYFMVENEVSVELIFKNKGNLHHLSEQAKTYLYTTNEAEITIDKKTFKIITYELKNDMQEIQLHKAAEMSIILQGAMKIHNYTN